MARPTSHRASRSASFSRSRRWTTPRPWARTSRWRSDRSPRRSRVSTPSARRWPTPMPISTRSWTRWASCKTRSMRRTAGISTPSSPRPWTRCSAPTWTPPVSVCSGGERRRVALCKLLLEAPDPAAARRADEPPGRRVDPVARAVPAPVQGRRHRRHARPLLLG